VRSAKVIDQIRVIVLLQRLVNNYLSYRRGTARCVLSVEILPVDTITRNSLNVLFLETVLFSPCSFYSRVAVSARLYARLSCLHCQAVAAYLMFFGQIK